MRAAKVLPSQVGITISCSMSSMDISRRGAFIIELLQDDPIPTTLYAGSTILILAHIRLKSQPASIVSSISASRQQSDDLMDDLEFHLDSSVRDHLSISLTIV
ncbi:hypothetical protein HYQ46_010926 [Verticillium longisporum]|nr:hypothetical protein HYQ46_010926 [Verticillium longisporum]